MSPRAAPFPHPNRLGRDRRASPPIGHSPDQRCRSRFGKTLPSGKLRDRIVLSRCTSSPKHRERAQAYLECLSPYKCAQPLRATRSLDRLHRLAPALPLLLRAPPLSLDDREDKVCARCSWPRRRDASTFPILRLTHTTKRGRDGLGSSCSVPPLARQARGLANSVARHLRLRDGDARRSLSLP